MPDKQRVLVTATLIAFTLSEVGCPMDDTAVLAFRFLAATVGSAGKELAKLPQAEALKRAEQELDFILADAH